MQSLPGAGRHRPRWLVPVVAVGAVLLLVVVPVVSAYNGLVDREQRVDTQFANIEVQLQRRADLIPNLASAVRAVLRQEQEVFGQIARARERYGSAGSADGKVAAANELESGLARLLVIVEQYPQLRSNENVRDLMVQLEGTENRVAQERRDYNEAVNDYNRAVRRFPRSLIASIFGFDRREPFAARPGATDVPRVDLDGTPGPSPAATP